MKKHRYLFFAVPLLVAACQPQTVEQPTAFDPEGATGWVDRQAVVLNEYMVVAANAYAADAGAEVIRQGGNAIDAAVAVQAMLTLVEPQSSGIGGGAFIMRSEEHTSELQSRP